MKKTEPRPEWLRRPERSNRLLLRFIVWVALRLGRPAARSLLHPICLYYLIFSPAPRRASRTFLVQALGRQPRFFDLYRHQFYFAACILDRVFLVNGRLDLFDVQAEGESTLHDVLARKNGAVLVGAHFGSFEIMRALGKSKGLLEVSLLMYQDNARMLAEAISAINPALDMEIIALGQRDTMLRVFDRLQQGAVIGMLADRTIEGEEQVQHTFLGRRAAFAIGPFRLAKIVRRPVILMVGLYRGGRNYDVHFEMLDAGGEDMAPPDKILGRYVDRLEYYVRRSPYNWFNFADVWNS